MAPEKKAQEKMAQEKRHKEQMAQEKMAQSTILFLLKTEINKSFKLYILLTKKWKRAAKKPKGRPRARMTSPSDGSPNTVLMLLNRLNRLNRLHYGFEKFIYFCFQQKKIACIIEIIEIKLCHFFLSCTLCHFFLCHFFLVPFFPVPFFPVPFFPVPFFPTLIYNTLYIGLSPCSGDTYYPQTS